jgi:ABC-type antimicrobial peptide transport system permease subunit
VLAFNVSERTQEFGIRLAIGATAAELMSLVVRRGAVLVGAGIVCGVAGAVAGGRLITGQLFEIGPLDPLCFAGATAFLAMVAMLACVLPAWRATRVGPVDVLRRE